MAKLKQINHSPKTYLTAIGLEKLQIELDELKTIKRHDISDRISRARELGDVAENAEYDAALDEQALVENRISDLEQALRQAKVIKNEVVQHEIVTIGSTIMVEMDGEVDQFTIVGRVEANPAKKLISNESPVGSALLGARIGETVEVATPIVRLRCKVLEIK